MRDNLDDKQKEPLKMEDNKRKKAQRDNLNVDEKEQMMIYEKKGRQLCMVTMMINKKSI